MANGPTVGPGGAARQPRCAQELGPCHRAVYEHGALRPPQTRRTRTPNCTRVVAILEGR